MRAFLLCCASTPLLLLLLAASASAASLPAFLRLPHDAHDADAAVDASSIHALLVVGSSGNGNYRHQADVMHVSVIPLPLPLQNLMKLGHKKHTFRVWNWVLREEERLRRRRFASVGLPVAHSLSPFLLSLPLYHARTHTTPGIPRPHGPRRPALANPHPLLRRRGPLASQPSTWNSH